MDSSEELNNDPSTISSSSSSSDSTMTNTSNLCPSTSNLHSHPITTTTPHMDHLGPIRRSRPSAAATPRFDPTRTTTTSSLSFTDRSFIEFTRCLYQTKSIVKDLQAFSESACPSFRVSLYNGQSTSSSSHDPRLASETFVRQVNQYLDAKFKKFSHLCRMLLMILDKMETSPTVKRERVQSFRTEVWEQIHTATAVKENLSYYFRQHVDLFITTTTRQQQQQQSSSSSSSSTPAVNSSSSSSSSRSSSPPLPNPAPPWPHCKDKPTLLTLMYYIPYPQA